jgi:hypothetical protein
VRSARTQVVAGFKMRLELDVPQSRVAALAPAADGATTQKMALNAVQLLPASRAPGAPLRLDGVVNNGCETGAEACAGRPSSHVGGMTFCCKAGCGRSCSVSASSVNGDIRAACSCAATLRVDMLHGPDGQVAQHGAALRLP